MLSAVHTCGAISNSRVKLRDHSAKKVHSFYGDIKGDEVWHTVMRKGQTKGEVPPLP